MLRSAAIFSLCSLLLSLMPLLSSAFLPRSIHSLRLCVCVAVCYACVRVVCVYLSRVFAHDFESGDESKSLLASAVCFHGGESATRTSTPLLLLLLTKSGSTVSRTTQRRTHERGGDRGREGGDRERGGGGGRKECAASCRASTDGTETALSERQHGGGEERGGD